VDYQKLAKEEGMPKTQYHPDPDKLGAEQLEKAEIEDEGDDEEILYNESTRGFQKIPEIDEEQFEADQKNLNKFVKDNNIEQKIFNKSLSENNENASFLQRAKLWWKGKLNRVSSFFKRNKNSPEGK
jgi:hypothetical protein